MIAFQKTNKMTNNNSNNNNNNNNKNNKMIELNLQKRQLFLKLYKIINKIN